MSELKARDFVIVNCCDRPRAGLVAIVTYIKDGDAICEYLSDNTYQNGAIAFPVKTVTKIEDFGMMIIVSQFQYIVMRHPTKVSVATYPDCRIRKWQEMRGEHIQPLKKKWRNVFMTPRAIGEFPEDAFKEED